MSHSTSHTSAEREHKLGLAGLTARTFIHSPLSPLLFFAMLAMGILGLMSTPRQEDPQISVPMIDVFVQYPGASTDQVVSLAVNPLERLLSEIPGVKHVYSASEREQGVITVRFKVGEEMGPSLVKVHDKLQANRQVLPPGALEPVVRPKGIDDVPVVTLTLWSEVVDDAAMRALGAKLLQSLSQIPNAGQGFVVGGRQEQIRVEVEPQRLAGFGVTFDHIAETIKTANAERRTGDAEADERHLTVYTGSFLRNASDVERLMLGTYNGAPIYIRDVARVSLEPEEYKQQVNYYTGPSYPGDAEADGMPAVTIALAKKEGSNGVTVANAILDKVEQLKGQLIPDNVRIEVTRNYGKTANDKVNELIFKLFVATGAVSLLILLALGIKPAIVVTLVIPVVLLMTVFSAWILGYTIDRVSLFALIFSIGILVDDAIVVVENIYRRWLMKGETDTSTAVAAVAEVGNPTIIATLTVVAALLPMGFVSGLMGPYMEPIPALGSAAMLFSLFAAFAFTPWLAMRIKPGLAAIKKAEEREHKTAETLEGFFRGLLVPLIERKPLGYAFLFGLIGAFFLSCGLFYAKAVAFKMLPYDNKPELSVVLDMPEGTALGKTVNTARLLADQVRGIPEVLAIQTYAGTAKPFDFNGMVRHYYLRQKPWQGEIQIQVTDKHERDRSSHEIALEVRDLLTPLAQDAGARITVVEMPPGPPVLQSVVAEIYGPDAKTRRQVAADMTQMFEEVDSLADVDNYMHEPYEILRFDVDAEKAVRLGISVDTVIRNLDMALGGFQAGDVKRGRLLEPTFITIEVPLAMRANLTRLSDLPIPTADGRAVPLTELGSFVKTPQDPIVYHKDLRPMEYVVGDAVGKLGAPLYPMLEMEDKLKDYRTPDGVTLSGTMFTGAPPDNGQSGFEWSGEWTVTYETFRDMGLAFGVALVLIYMLVVAEFGNFVTPGVIMAPIPLTLLGIVPGHWLLGADFTATSMIGFIALAGIIVRNSILLVDFSIEEVERGQSVTEAVISACKARTRPILITALALVAGSSVILTDPIFQGMAISLLFGVLVSTLLTLVVIPLGCVSAGKYLVRRGSTHA
ncbi:efflux RND transporter permease subunit [Thiorhodococcus minor]|uniref:Efflux RND transporter permease subunit n=1 Tax=Thiorhodococcus minor TaxID=57489 RepID=A0A6M0K5H0_9GAMM|nr:efflux RND transporter permease subunit [Thiorhodococcus minor]NEV64970.1 efflux RND transporter permease subunit [Thiorhodococcus minor]